MILSWNPFFAFLAEIFRQFSDEQVKKTLFGFMGLWEIGDLDLDRDFFLRGEGVLDPYFR